MAKTSDKPAQSVRRRADSGPQGTRSGSQAPRHVHRLHRRRAACTTSSTRSSTTRSTRRWPATATSIAVDDPRRRLDHRRGQRPRHPGRHPPDREDPGRRARHDRAARRRQVRQGHATRCPAVCTASACRSSTRSRRAQGLGQARRQEHYMDFARGSTTTKLKVLGKAGAKETRHEGLVQAGPRDLHRAALRLRDARGAPARALVPEQGRHHHAHRRARRARRRRRRSSRRAASGDGAVPQREPQAAAPRGDLRRDRDATTSASSSRCSTTTATTRTSSPSSTTSTRTKAARTSPASRAALTRTINNYAPEAATSSRRTRTSR